jgi:alcohol dehydrogenase class IV
MSSFTYLTQILIEFGALKFLADECQKHGITKPLIVTDAGIKAAGLLLKTLDAMAGFQCAVFDATPSNPTEAAVRAATALCHASNCNGLIALGGGSSIDCAKGVAIAATHPGPMTTYATIEGGSGRITDKVLPLIAVPTTAGTGSEVARGAIVIVDDGRKLGFHSWHLVPKAAILDPELTLGLPPLMTAATGMDALAHCMETFMSTAFNPPADGIALDGLARCWSHIEAATRNGQDRDARLQMMSASMQGALAFQKGLGCVHSLSHSLGGINPKLHHGTLNAVFLPAVIAFNAKVPALKAERRLERMAEAMGLPASANPAQSLGEAIRAMNHKLGLPSGLAAMGVVEAQFDAIVQGALADHSHKTNPREASDQDYRDMLQASM